MFLEDVSGSKSFRDGLAKVLGRDDLDWDGPENTTGFDGKYTPQMMEWLKQEGATILKEGKERLIVATWGRVTFSHRSRRGSGTLLPRKRAGEMTAAGVRGSEKVPGGGPGAKPLGCWGCFTFHISLSDL